MSGALESGRTLGERARVGAIPESILAPESPGFHDPAAFAANDTVARETVSSVRGRSASVSAGSA